MIEDIFDIYNLEGRDDLDGILDALELINEKLGSYNLKKDQEAECLKKIEEYKSKAESLRKDANKRKSNIEEDIKKVGPIPEEYTSSSLAEEIAGHELYKESLEMDRRKQVDEDPVKRQRRDTAIKNAKEQIEAAKKREESAKKNNEQEIYNKQNKIRQIQESDIEIDGLGYEESFKKADELDKLVANEEENLKKIQKELKEYDGVSSHKRELEGMAINTLTKDKSFVTYWSKKYPEEKMTVHNLSKATELYQQWLKHKEKNQKIKNDYNSIKNTFGHDCVSKPEHKKHGISIDVSDSHGDVVMNIVCAKGDNVIVDCSLEDKNFIYYKNLIKSYPDADVNVSSKDDPEFNDMIIKAAKELQKEGLDIKIFSDGKPYEQQREESNKQRLDALQSEASASTQKNDNKNQPYTGRRSADLDL